MCNSHPSGPPCDIHLQVSLPDGCHPAHRGYFLPHLRLLQWSDSARTLWDGLVIWEYVPQTVSQSAGQGANQWLNSLPETLEGLFLRHFLLFSEAPTWHPHIPFRMDTEVTQLMWLLIFRGFPPALPTATTVVLLLRATFLGSLILGGHGGWGEPRVLAPPKGHPS